MGTVGAESPSPLLFAHESRAETAGRSGSRVGPHDRHRGAILQTGRSLMGALRRGLARVGGWFTRRRREHDFDDELHSHVEMHVNDGIRAGLSPGEARRRALVALGGLQQTREAYADGL